MKYYEVRRHIDGRELHLSIISPPYLSPLPIDDVLDGIRGLMIMWLRDGRLTL